MVMDIVEYGEDDIFEIFRNYNYLASRVLGLSEGSRTSSAQNS
jgi:hypothetical protein